MRVLLLLLLLSGCMVGPNYKTPQVNVPFQFEQNAEANPCTDEQLCHWWHRFEDPLLNSYIEEAVVSNFNVRIALEKIAAARAEYKIQGSFLWPQINANAVATRSRYSQNIFTTATSATDIAAGDQTPSARGSMFGPAVQNFFQVGFDAVWELDFWGKFRRGKRAAFDMWEASQFDAQNVLILTISEVAKTYVQIRSLQHQLAILKEKIATTEKELTLINALFHTGLDSMIDVETKRAEFEQSLALVPSLESSLKTTLYAFALLLGKQPEALHGDFLTLAPIPPSAGQVPAGLPSDLLRRRPDLRAAERQLAAATEKIGMVVAKLFPSISLTGNGYGYESNQAHSLFSSPSRYWSIGPSINWDLIDFGKTYGQIDLNNALQRQALLQYEQSIITALQDVEGALVAYFEEQKRHAHLVKEYTAQESKLSLTTDLFYSGLTNELSVLTALKLTLDAKTALIQSNEALSSNLISLYKALGGSWECSSSL